METSFGKNNILCLNTVLQEQRSAEQTQEIKLSDGLPDIGQILAAWGQVILRSKEWRGDSIACSGGLMVWVLYEGEDGSGPQWIDTWIPFQLKWDLPEDTSEGSIRMDCRCRFVDARPVSARKIMIRAGVTGLAQALTEESVSVYEPQQAIPGVELLRSVYPVRLPKEAGERAFLQDEEIPFPDGAARPETLLCCRLSPRITDKKVLTDKMVFRGGTGLHVLYRCEEGRLHSVEMEAPFSQYAELQGEFGADAQGDLWLCPTSMEAELDDEKHLRLKCGMVAQYLITDKQPVEIIEDAYSPGSQLEMEQEQMELPAVLEARKENLYGEQTIRADGRELVDVTFLPDLPRQQRTDSGVDLAFPGTFQTLYYGEDGLLHASTARWEGNLSLNADENSRIRAIPMGTSAQGTIGSDSMTVKAELPVGIVTTARQSLPMVTGVTTGEQNQPDPGRPSLILRRAGENGLWDIAKSSGSTMDAIRKANQLNGEPAPGQMLLIPIL